MTLSLSAPSETYVGQVEVFDARLSTDVSIMPQADSSPSFTIDYGDGFNCNLLASGHAYKNPGTYTVSLTGKNSSGTSSALTHTIVVRDIPAGTTVDIANAGNAQTNFTNVQNAINTAAQNNATGARTITLASDMVIAGSLTLPIPVGNNYISIVWKDLAVPNNRRVTAADMARAPIITAPTAGGPNTRAIGTPSPAPTTSPHHYRLVGLHLKKDTDSMPAQRLLDLGIDVGARPTSVPHHFIVERCWFDGGASDTSQVTNAVRIYADYVTVKDCLMAEFRLIGAGVDAAAVSLSIGNGPFSFQNNTMVATSENFNIAGGGWATTANVSNATTSTATLSHVNGLEVDDSIAFTVNGLYHSTNSSVVRSISGNNITFDPIPNVPNGTAEWVQATPSFIEFRGNYLYKPLKWWSKHSSWNGVNYQIKNLWEAKWLRYCVVDGNYLHQTWVADQIWAVALTVRNRTGGETRAACLRHLQWSNNILRDTPNGYQISASDDGGDQGNVSARTSDITFRNNLHWNTGRNWDPTGSSHAFLNMGQAQPNNKLRRIFVIHNTHDNGIPSNDYGVITDFAGSPPGGANESVWLNNVHQGNGYGFRSNASSNAAENITNYFPPGTTNWNKNLIVNTNGNVYPASAIVMSAPWATGVFVDRANGDFTLKVGNPGKGAATDGKDVGVDMAALKYATRGCVSGVWDGSTTPDVPPPPPPVDNPPPPPPPPTTVTPSPDGTKAATINDATGGVWTIGPGKETLRNGTQAAAGLGTIYKYVSGVVNVLGLDSNWYKWVSPNWVLIGGTEPGTVYVPPPPPVDEPPTPPAGPVIGALKKDVPWTVSEAADNAEAKKQAALGYYFKAHQTGKKATFVYTGVKLGT